MMGLPQDTSCKGVLKANIIIYLRTHGPTGGEVLRKAVGRIALKPGVVFGRSLFGEIMRELVASGTAIDEIKHYRHTFSLART